MIRLLPGFGSSPPDPEPIAALPARDDAAIAEEREKKRLAGVKTNRKKAKTRLTPADGSGLGKANTRGGAQLGSGDTTSY